VTREGLYPERIGPYRVTGLIVTFEIPRDVQLHTDAIVELIAPVFGAGTALRISSVGSEQPYTPDVVLDGQLPTMQLVKDALKEMGIRDKQREQLLQMLANITAITEQLRTDLPEIASKMKSTLDHADASMARVEKLLEDVAPTIRDGLTDARQALADVREVIRNVRERYKTWRERVDSITSGIDESVKLVRDIVKDNGPTITKFINDAGAIMVEVREKRLKEVEKIIAKIDKSMDNFMVSTAELRDLLVSQRPVLERTLANAQLASDQLKLATIEIRRSPWRLLYVPKDEELETDNLYDAARAFALAAGTLDAASQELRAVVEKTPDNKAEIERQIKHLELLFERFEDAEQRFKAALEERAPKSD